MTVLSDFPRVGDLFLGRYRIESILGSGGFARVYRATQTDLDRDVAIKVMRPGVEREDSTEETIAQIELVEQRFRREAKVISKFRSPCTVVVHDYGRTEGGLLFMTLEYVDGDTLSRIIKREAPLPPERAVFLARQVLESLHEAHAFDVLHRDIKPQNLMVFSHLDQHDLVKVLDFGIAKVLEVEEESAAVQELTTDGTLIGTPRYMSPEQIRGDRLTPASDLYSLGLVLYEALTGVKAVSEKTTMRIIAVHLDPRPLEFPANKPLGAGMRAILEKMLAKDPNDRFQSAKDVLAAFDAWNPNEPVVIPGLGRAQPPAEKPVPLRKSHETPTVGATLAAELPGEPEPAMVVVEPEFIDIGVDPIGAVDTEAEAEEPTMSPPATDGKSEELINPTVPMSIDQFDFDEAADEKPPIAPLVAAMDEPEDTLDRPFATTSSRLIPIIGIGVVAVVLLGLVGVIAMSNGDDAQATTARDGTDLLDDEPAPAAVEEPVELAAEAAGKDPDGSAAESVENLNDTEPDSEPDSEPKDEPKPAPDKATPPKVELKDEGSKQQREPAKADEDHAETAEEVKKPTPVRRPPKKKKRNKLWSLE